MTDRAMALIEKLAGVIDEQRRTIVELQAKSFLHGIVITRAMQTGIMGDLDAESRDSIEGVITSVLQMAAPGPDGAAIRSAAEMLRYSLDQPGGLYAIASPEPAGVGE